MGLRKYVRQVRPIQENKVDHVRKVQGVVLSEASFADLFKRDNHAQFLKNPIRRIDWCF